MPYTSEEIKKWLDDAVNKARTSSEKYKAVEAGGASAGQPDNKEDVKPDESQTPEAPVTDIPAAKPEPEPDPADAGDAPYDTRGVIPDEPTEKPTAATPEKPPAATRDKPPAETQLIVRNAPTRPAPARRPKPPAAAQKPGANQMSPRPAPQKPAPAQRPAPPAVPGGTGKVRVIDLYPVAEPKGIPGAEQELDAGPADFKMKFDFESAYRDVPEEKPVRLRRERRTGCIGGLLYAIFVICVSLVLASLAWLAASDVLGFGAADEQVNVTVSKGFKMEDIIDTLYDAGLIKYKALFKLYADYSKAETKISAGQYVLNKNFDYRALVYGMTARGGVLVETTVTIPEGFTLAQIYTRLDDYGVCKNADEFWDAVANHDFKYSFLNKSTRGDRHRLEGFLFPDTYNFYLDSSPVQVLNRLLSEFDRKFTETYIERAEFLGYTVHDIITIASMIEREAGSDEERPRIAAVIYNRLNNSDAYPYLQIDATYVYAAAGTGRPPSVDIDSPYNTYLHAGLPPGPIANPGMESILAALYPESTKEYYYALNKNHTHEFFKTLAEQEAFVASDKYGGER